MPAATKLRDLSTEELWQIYHSNKDVEVRNEIILRYNDLVKCIAFKTVGNFQHFNYMDDIVNEGLIALLDAVEKFNLEKKVKFETFASIKIKGAMIDYIRKQDCFPRRIKKLAKTISEAESQLGHKLGRSPTDQELADYMKVSLEELHKWQAETCSLNMFSFEELVYEKGLESVQGYASSGDDVSSGQRPEQAFVEKELQDVLAANISELNEKEQLIIALYYKEQFKAKEIAEILEISESRVSQIHSAALKKLRGKMENYINL
ncbi:MAG: FliA/WhiG family RNA polymerase sigma factor [Clostridiales bacterium]|nr:FliA/WhiG family RNA polymerase sigma factor [Clostridiales bacterium]